MLRGSTLFQLRQPRRSQSPERASKWETTSGVKWLGAIGEYRIDWGPGYRIYLAKEGDDIIMLLGGGTKRRQQTDIERARILWQEYKSRKAAQFRQKGR
jgi:putative addiction module killer protein